MYIPDRCHFTGAYLPEIELKVEKLNRELYAANLAVYERATELLNKILKDEKQLDHLIDMMYGEMLEYWLEDVIKQMMDELKCSRAVALYHLKNMSFKRPEIDLSLKEPTAEETKVVTFYLRTTPLHNVRKFYFF